MCIYEVILNYAETSRLILILQNHNDGNEIIGKLEFSRISKGIWK